MTMTDEETTAARAKLLPEGRYKAAPQRHEIVQTATDRHGNPILKMGIEFRIVEGARQGRLITFMGGFEGKGEAFTTKAMKTCGWDGRAATIEGAWRYEQVSITVIHRCYEKLDPVTKETKTRWVAEVQYINALDDAGPKPGLLLEKLAAPVDAKAAFLERLGAKLAVKDDALDAPADPTHDAGAEMAGDEDIPF